MARPRSKTPWVLLAIVLLTVLGTLGLAGMPVDGKIQVEASGSSQLGLCKS